MFSTKNQLAFLIWYLYTCSFSAAWREDDATVRQEGPLQAQGFDTFRVLSEEQEEPGSKKKKKMKTGGVYDRQSNRADYGGGAYADGYYKAQKSSKKGCKKEFSATSPAQSKGIGKGKGNIENSSSDSDCDSEEYTEPMGPDSEDIPTDADNAHDTTEKTAAPIAATTKPQEMTNAPVSMPQEMTDDPVSTPQEVTDPPVSTPQAVTEAPASTPSKVPATTAGDGVIFYTPNPNTIAPTAAATIVTPMPSPILPVIVETAAPGAASVSDAALAPPTSAPVAVVPSTVSPTLTTTTNTPVVPPAVETMAPVLPPV